MHCALWELCCALHWHHHVKQSESVMVWSCLEWHSWRCGRSLSRRQDCVSRQYRVLFVYVVCCWRRVPWRMWHEGQMEGGALQLYWDLLVVTFWFSMEGVAMKKRFGHKFFFWCVTFSFCCWWHFDFGGIKMFLALCALSEEEILWTECFSSHTI